MRSAQRVQAPVAARRTWRSPTAADVSAWASRSRSVVRSSSARAEDGRALRPLGAAPSSARSPPSVRALLDEDVPLAVSSAPCRRRPRRRASPSRRPADRRRAAGGRARRAGPASPAARRWRRRSSAPIAARAATAARGRARRRRGRRRPPAGRREASGLGDRRLQLGGRRHADEPRGAGLGPDRAGSRRAPAGGRRRPSPPRRPRRDSACPGSARCASPPPRPPPGPPTPRPARRGARRPRRAGRAARRRRRRRRARRRWRRAPGAPPRRWPAVRRPGARPPGAPPGGRRRVAAASAAPAPTRSRSSDTWCSGSVATSWRHSGHGAPTASRPTRPAAPARCCTSSRRAPGLGLGRLGGGSAIGERLDGADRPSSAAVAAASTSAAAVARRARSASQCSTRTGFGPASTRRPGLVLEGALLLDAAVELVLPRRHGVGGDLGGDPARPRRRPARRSWR